MTPVDPRHAWMRDSTTALSLQLLLKASAKHIGSLVRVENSISPPTLDLMPISQEEIDHSALLFEAQRLAVLLEPYPNNNMMFHSRLQRFEADDHMLAIFGQVLGGLFFVDLKDGSVGLLPIDCEVSLQDCNSDLRSFAAVHTAFMAEIRPALNSNEGIAESTLMELEDSFRNCDATSMADENNFWPTCLYELSEGFFPLSSKKVELHRSLGIDLNHPW
ncbi:SUKH-4 family immunity protein [Stenotrophomonas maltophilia]|uniref:SUKH-4 family immunity protein n=1 Tax=Stenotrophomonas maltophilia TaxID=40324 RepID=UPI0021C92C33|nr:SUKH-4 family immunity protein [Stenotrophomonas maltophilia]MCU1125070.1 SUKH-4 family immunity protein [Stenotrophomonas maltophilia]